MKPNNFFKLAIAIAISEAAGIIGAIFTTSEISGWYATLIKPELNPPDWLFGPVWTLLYALMGIALYLVWKNKWRVKHHILEKRQKPWNRFSERFWTGSWQKQNIIAIFSLQLILNILWTYIFFGLKFPLLAFFEILALWFAILYTIINFYRVSKAAAYLLVPYILWVSFAAYLNFAVFTLNDPMLATQENNISLPVGYTLKTYVVAKMTETACVNNSDCETPPEYMMLSSCPYTSLCLKSQCAIVCPSYAPSQ